MPRIDTTTSVEFLRFWNWEYLKRNAQFLTDFEALEADGTKTIFLENCGFTINASAGKDVLESNSFLSSDSPAFQSSETVLNDTILGRLRYHRPGLRIDLEGFRPLIQDTDGQADPVLLKMHTSAEQPFKPYYVDLSKPLKQLEAELRFIHQAYTLSLSSADIDSTHDVSLRQKGNIQRIPASRDLPRAIGIWLWDRFQAGHLKNQCYREFRARYQSENSGQLYLEQDYAEHYLGYLIDITDRCISDTTAHPLKA